MSDAFINVTVWLYSFVMIRMFTCFPIPITINKIGELRDELWNRLCLAKQQQIDRLKLTDYVSLNHAKHLLNNKNILVPSLRNITELYEKHEMYGGNVCYDYFKLKLNVVREKRLLIN